MQTFLPYPDYYASAKVLDNKRLGKQRVEAKQIVLALCKPGYGWQNHPAVRMWWGHVWALSKYGAIMCAEWRARGFKDSLQEFFNHVEYDDSYIYWTDHAHPEWLYDERFHASHRSNLLRKDPIWYGQFGWKEPNDLPYVWPVL